jgi:hypothetical protein
MWLDTFADQLRRGLDAVREELDTNELDAARRAHPALERFTVSSLIAFARSPRGSQAGQDAVWLALVRCYRHRPAHLWTPVLLQMLAPALIGRAYRLALAWPHIDPAEIQQQLVAEVLLAAGSLHLGDGSRRVQQRLLGEARHRVEAWLRGEAANRPLSLDAARERRRVGRSTDVDAAHWLLSELRLSVDLAEDMELVVRLAVLRQSADEVAKAMDIAPDDVGARFRRARRRIRRELAR